MWHSIVDNTSDNCILFARRKALIRSKMVKSYILWCTLAENVFPHNTEQRKTVDCRAANDDTSEQYCE